jgi:hypothetical protein
VAPVQRDLEQKLRAWMRDMDVVNDRGKPNQTSQGANRP